MPFDIPDIEMNLQLIETFIVLGVYVLIRVISNKTIGRTVRKSLMQKTRGKVMKKGLNAIILLVAFTFLFFIWGVNQSELIVFIGSFLAVLGVAFFAQWSILSNITAGIIIFFSHPVKLD